ncbi:MAG: hypothetical protein ACRDMJ_15065 [Solirubrobacteraceae bacterium]
MAAERSSEYVAECLWPDVRDSDLRALDRRATLQAERMAAHGEPVRYLGSMLMREDEVVLCVFRGDRELVRRAAVAAAIPFDRLLEAARSPWGGSAGDAAEL